MNAINPEHAAGDIRSGSLGMMWVNLCLCIASGAVAVGVILHVSGGHQIDGFVFLAFSPFIALGCAAVLLRKNRDDSVMTLLAALLMAALLVLEIYDYRTDQSSMSPLVFLFIPLGQWCVIALAAVIVFAIRFCRRVGV